MFAAKALLAAALASTALAHFTLDYPLSRGFDEDTEPDFCGGFTTVEARQPFPLSSGPIWIDSHHTLATVDAFISTSADPQSFSDFNTTSNGTDIPLLTSYFQVGEGEYCWNVDFAGLNLGLTNGSLVTLQIQFDGPDGYLYQCADLVLLSNYTVPSNDTCTSDAAASFSATHTGTLADPATATATSATTTSGASASASASASSSSTSGAEARTAGIAVVVGAALAASLAI
ncbi:hypothetical protein Q5752_006443 [Cryptotrichosporon argae]